MAIKTFSMKIINEAMTRVSARFLFSDSLENGFLALARDSSLSRDDKHMGKIS